jgi:8-oxo-dGTP diphosphatase
MPDNSPVLCTAVVVLDPSPGPTSGPISCRVLLLRRRADSDGPLAGCWHFPGGKLKAGESAPECARRELHEETRLKAYVLWHIGTNHHDGMDGIVFLAREWSGDPVNAEPEKHDAIGWFNVEEPPEPLYQGSNQVLEWIRKGMIVL